VAKLDDEIGGGSRYDAVFIDVDGTLLWVGLDVEGYVEDLAPYSRNGRLTVEKATGPVWESMRRHIRENLEHRTDEELADFKRRNAEQTAEELGIEAPVEVLTEVGERRISFNPYPESEAVLRRLKTMGAELYVVGIVISALLGVEKPDPRIFEEALRISGVREERVVHVGNDPVADIRGAAAAGIDTVLVDREGDIEAPEATFVIPDLNGLPEIVRG
jgi:putative hydrolase of the HAD superfamily